jgi:hypothetical protein
MIDLFSAEAKLAEEFGVPAQNVCIVGSTLICGDGNDIDFLCLLPSDELATKCGFAPDVELSYESPLRSFRREGQNAIVTTEPWFFYAEIAIAHAAAAIASWPFEMSNRDERIRFHSMIRGAVLRRAPDAAREGGAP